MADEEIAFSVGDKDAVKKENSKLQFIEQIMQEAEELSPEDRTLIAQAISGGMEDDAEGMDEDPLEE